MASTGLKSDAWCNYNQAAAPFFWIFQEGQYENTLATGEVGISPAGGTAGSYVRQNMIDVDSFLSGRDEILSRCQPPVPQIESIRTEPKQAQDTLVLLPMYSREKKSAIDLDSIDYNRWTPQNIDPQDLQFIIDNLSAQRGGLDSRNYTKKAWNTPECNYNLNPARACGKECEDLGYSTKSKTHTKPPNYPYPGPYPKNLNSVGIYSTNTQQT